MNPDRHTWIIAVVLACVTAGVYWQVHRHDFIELDDGEYLLVAKIGLASQPVQVGLGFHESNWHPITWWSHMADCALFGLDDARGHYEAGALDRIQPGVWGLRRSGMHHLVNLLFHVANGVLLMLILRAMTGAVWRSALAAALFALHPLHVESVAWIAERKDVLSAFFWLLTMWAYVWYTRRPGRGRMVVVAVLLALGLMSKPMVVTLPMVLLLLDYWPLKRITSLRTARDMVVEKLPLLAMSLASCLLTYQAQSGQAVQSLEDYPLRLRLANAVVSYVLYLRDTFWPRGLAVFYPYPRQGIALGQVALAAAVLVAITVAVVFSARRRGYLLVGWLWFLGTMVPVIGLVQVGWQARADRYTYIPLIGVFIAIAWLSGDIFERISRSGSGFAARVFAPFFAKIIVGGVWAVLLVALATATYFQVQRWRDTETLFKYTLRVTRDNYMMNQNLGAHYNSRKMYDEAIPYLLAAADIRPTDFNAHCNLGHAYIHKEQWEAAMEELEKALAIDPDSLPGLIDRTFVYMKMDDPDWDLAAQDNEHVHRVLPGIDPNFSYRTTLSQFKRGAKEELARAQRRADDNPTSSTHLARLAWLYATIPTAELRDGEKAVDAAQKALAADADDLKALRALAAGYAELAWSHREADKTQEAAFKRSAFDRAAATAQKALEKAINSSNNRVTSQLQRELRNYQNDRPVREPSETSTLQPLRAPVS